jgi:hypothetical protein
MRKIVLILVCLFSVLSVSAQFMRSEELEKYAKEKYGDDWNKAAENLGATLSLDMNKSLTYSEVIQCGEKTKQQLYILLNQWFTMSFNDANSVIKLNDKEAGVIIGQGYVEDIASHSGGTNSYRVSIKPTIKVDIKDNKIRVTYTIQYYDVDKLSGGGIMGAIGGNRNARLVEEKWPLESCFPFSKKDKHKKTSSKALVMAHAYSSVIMDKIENAVKNGLTGSETEDW